MNEKTINKVGVNQAFIDYYNNPKSSEYLKPCPFCGKKPEWVNLLHPSGKPGIKCMECNFSITHDRKDKTLYHWNKRFTNDVNLQEFISAPLH